MKKPDTLRLEVALSPLQKALIEELRGLAKTEDFLCRLIEIGLSQIVISMGIHHKDTMIEELEEATIGKHEQARAILFKVNNGATQQPTIPEPTTEAPTNGNGVDPTPRHLPKGLR
jgi:hypothetical protein